MKPELPRLKTAMTPFPYAVGVDAHVAEARALMEEHAIHHLPVTRAGRVVGMLSSAALAAHSERLEQTRVGEVYARDAYVVDIGEPLEHVVTHMARARIDAAIVMRRGKLAGVFTCVDACRALAKLLAALTTTPGGDEAA